MKHVCTTLMLAALLLLTGCSTVTLRVVDAQTHQPLAHIAVEHSKIVFGGPGLMGQTTAFETGADGIVHIPNVGMGDYLAVNPPIRPTGLVMGAASERRWINGRREAVIDGLFPQVTYHLWTGANEGAGEFWTDGQKQTAAQVNGANAVALPDDVPAITARINALLAAPDDGGRHDALWRATYELVRISGPETQPTVRRVFEKLCDDFLSEATKTGGGQSPSTFALASVGRNLKDDPQAIAAAHRLNDQCAPLMRNPTLLQEEFQRIHLW